MDLISDTYFHGGILGNFLLKYCRVCFLFLTFAKICAKVENIGIFARNISNNTFLILKLNC